MKAVILVGGEGTRLRPLTYLLPKAMVPVLNMPFIHHICDYLNKHNINQIIFSMGYKPDIIKKYFQSAKCEGTEIIYSMENTPLGTAGAVRLAQKYINKNETIFVLNGDIFTDADLRDMFNFHTNNKAKVSIALTEVEDPTHFGVVELDNRQRIKRFVEKPKKEYAPSNLINAGIYIIDADILDLIPDNTFYMFEHNLFPSLISSEKVYGYIIKNSYWIDMGTPQKYQQLNTDLLMGKCAHYRLKPDSLYISNECNIHKESHMIPPIMIGKNCHVAKGSIIIGPSVIGHNCNIKEESTIENSILWDNITIGGKAIIKNSIIINNMIIENNSNIENQIIYQMR